jgi:putative acetyltransferase
MMTICPEPSMQIVSLEPTLPAAQALIALSDANMQALYPAESNHLESIAALQLPNVNFVGAYIDSTLVACGAVKIIDHDLRYGELKRMFVLESHRGMGLSSAILAHLETHLLSSGVPVARLETGIKQPEALNLYRRRGYRERPPFGTYQADPLSIFMEKNLA